MSEGIELSPNAQKILDLVKELSVVELNALVKSLEAEFGVSAAAPVMMAGWGAAGWDDEWGNDAVSVELTEVGQQKIAVIKVVKDILGLGLKEAKDIVEKAPTFVKEAIALEEAQALQAKLQEAGATITLK